MICLKCGKEIKDNEQICSNCGYNKNTIGNTDNPFGVKNQGIYNPNPVDKEKVAERLEHQKQFNDLTEIYIGNKYYNFKKGKFSWCAFFFGPLYYMYRKLYSVGIITYIIEALITGFCYLTYTTPLKFLILYSILSLIFRIFIGITFKKFYFNEIIERVAKIKHKNPDLGFNQLSEYTRKKGGTNILIVVIIITITLIIFAIITSYIITTLESIQSIYDLIYKLR